MTRCLPRLALVLFVGLLATSLARSSTSYPMAAWPVRGRLGPGAAPDLQHPPGYDLAPVTQLLEGAVARAPLQGAALLLAKDGQVIYERAFGAFALETAVPIASGSKWLTAATVMTLVDDGLIGLDDPVSAYLPELSGPAAAITMRQLLANTSGLPNLHPSLDRRDITLAECVEQIAHSGLVAAPGSCVYYSTAAFQVAGRVAEVASGRPWAELFEERIAAPLGMSATTYGETSNPVLGGGAVTTLRDYGRFLQMQLDGGAFAGQQVLSLAALREMQANQTGELPIVLSVHPDGRRCGLGQWRDIVDERGCAIQLSSQGDTGFSPWIDLQRNLLGVFLVNDSLGNVYGLVSELQARTRAIIDGAEGRP